MAISVSAIVPSSDRIAGGAAAIILGSGFVATPSITVGSIAATSVVLVSGTKLTCVVPAHAVGTVNVVVTNPDTTNATLVNSFTYYTPFADLTAVHIDVGGRDAAFDYGSISISRSSSQEQANFRVEDQTNPPFSPVKIGLGSFAASDLLFIGKEQITKQSAKVEILSNPLWDCTVAGSLAEFNRILAWGNYVGISADVVAIDLIQKYAPDFTWAHIPSGLATVTALFQGETMDAVFTQLKTLIGGYYYRDDSYDVHLFVTETPDLTPDPLDAANQTLIVGTLLWQADVAQIRNRVIGIGAGVALLASVNSGETIIPVEDTTIFDATGTVLIVTQRVTHTGKTVGGAGAFVQTISTATTAPGSGPGAALSTTVGRLSGTYSWKVSFATTTGETISGPASGDLVCASVASPGSGPSAAASATIGAMLGVYSYKTTFVTALGETVPGPASGNITCSVFAPPSTCSLGTTGTIGPLSGTYSYKTTFVTSLGETTPSSAASLSPSAVAAPAISVTSSLDPVTWTTVDGRTLSGGKFFYKQSIVTAYGETMGAASTQLTVPTVPAIGNAPGDNGAVAGGALTGGAVYKWKATVVYASGQTLAGPATAAITPVAGSGNFTRQLARPVSLNTTFAIFWRLYRTSGNGTTFRLVAEIAIATGTYNDGAADGDLGQLEPSSNSVGVAIVLNVGTGSTGTTARRMYRTKDNGSSAGSYYLIGELSDNSTTAFTDVLSDAEISSLMLASASLGQQVSITSIPTGPTGTLARRVYRTVAGGSEHKFLTQLSDNSTTSFTDIVLDINLGSTAPLVNTAGAQTASLTSILTGPTGTLARRIYRTAGGGSEYKYLAELADNTTTTFSDTFADTSLGNDVPLVNTAGASSVNLTSIPIGGAGVTQRIIYRTLPGGSVYFYVGTINDNATTTFFDNIPDTSLGRAVLTTATAITLSGGAAVGATSLVLTTVTGFPTAGWVTVKSQLVRYTGITSATLTGIPASGTGSIANAIQYGEQVTATPALTGVPASGTGSIVESTIDPNTSFYANAHLYTTRNNVTSQNLIQAIEGGKSTGIYEFKITDSSLVTQTSLDARCDAELLLFSDASGILQVNGVSYDKKLRYGRPLHVAMPWRGLYDPAIYDPAIYETEQFLTGDFVVQTVSVSEIGTFANQNPKFAFMASSLRYTLEDLLRNKLGQ